MGDERRGLAYRREHLGREQFDGLRDLGIGQAADIDLTEEPVQAKQLALAHELVDHLLRAADKNGTGGTGPLLVDITRNATLEVGARRMFAE